MDKTWIFLYDRWMDLNKLKSNNVDYLEYRKTTLKNYQLYQKTTDLNNSKSSIISSAGSMVDGILVLLDDTNLKRIEKLFSYPDKKSKVTVDARIKDGLDSKKVLAYVYIDKGMMNKGFNNFNINTISGGQVSNFPMGLDKMKDSKRDFKWDKTMSAGNSFVMTFEEFKIENDKKNILL